MLKQFIIFSFLLSGLHVLAQTSGASEPESLDPGPFYGFWEFKEAAGDTCVIIIKRGGQLSCFWSGTKSQTIQKGTWTREADQLTARWDSGYVDVFEKLGDNAIERRTFGAGDPSDETPDSSVRGVRVDSRIPGSLTVERDDDSMPIIDTANETPAEAPAIPIRNAYVGFWKIPQDGSLFDLGSSEPHFYLRLSRSGDASVALRTWEGDPAVTGAWRIESDSVIITWPNNRRDVLRPAADGNYELASFKPKDSLDRKPRELAPAEKVIASEAERYFEAGDFKRLTVLDIRGTWTPEVADEDQGYISIEGWGNAFRFPSKTGSGGSDPGKWRLLNDRVIITWVDGSKDVLRISFPDMVQESYAASEPLTGTPFRTVKVGRSE
jgi:hypothetical protein